MKLEIPKKFVAFIAIAFASLFTFAQVEKCLLSGCLIDRVSGEALPFTTIYSELERDTMLQVITDANGCFVIPDEVKSMAIRIQIAGYESIVSIPEDYCNHFQLYYAQPIANQLSEVIVSGFQNASTREKIPASIGYLKRDIIQGTDQTSLQNSLNTIPGVIMESRGYGGSHRVSIRGSALRSPFAVRNIKMYLEGIPLTSPDGQAPMELIDPFDISSIEVIKGPAGSVWGSGNGGAMLFKTKKVNPGVTSVQSGIQAGSYDLYRMTNSAEIGLTNGGLRVSHIWQDNAGYRQQESNHKNQVSLSLTKFLNEKNKLFAFGTYYNGNWGLPGALSTSQVLDDERQAVQFSKDNNASMHRQRVLSGISHSHYFNGRFRETTSLYYYSTAKSNPYGTSSGNSGFKDEGADGFGGRTDWTYEMLATKKRPVGAKINFGGEWQSEKFNILEDKIHNGVPGDFKYLYDIGYITSMAFVSADLIYTDRVVINGGTSINQTSQDVRGRNAAGFTFDTTATWQSQLLPRAAISVRAYKQLHVFASLSYGNANPTAFEMVDYENDNYNLSLKPERGINKEVGIKHFISKINLQYEVNCYLFELHDAILSYTDTASRNFYQNAGGTKQSGVEWTVSKIFNSKRYRLNLRVWNSGSIYDYQFASYFVGGKDYTNKFLPGVPKSNVSTGMAFTIANDFQLEIMDYWFDKTPLDNSNTNWSSPYHLLNTRLSYNRIFIEHLAVQVYAGINNLLDTHYTSNFGLNGFGGRFYNPAPGINYYGGITISWRF